MLEERLHDGVLGRGLGVQLVATHLNDVVRGLGKDEPVEPHDDQVDDIIIPE